MLHNIPNWFKRSLPGYTWQYSNESKHIYLTFDDGPIPGITEWVMEVLNEYNIKASFFVVGKNAMQNPEILRAITREKHTVGNHTFHHIKGWRTPTQKYIDDVVLCSERIGEIIGQKPKYFRPPYGRISPSQAKLLRESYEIIMWSVLTRDYSPKLKMDNILRKSIKYTKGGSLVVFHDSLKAEKNLKFVLPKYIEHFLEKGYSFKPLP